MQDLIFKLGFYLTLPGLGFLVLLLLLTYKEVGRKFNFLIVVLIMTVLISYFFSISTATNSKNASLQKTSIALRTMEGGAHQESRIKELDSIESDNWNISLFTSIYCLLTVGFMLTLTIRKYAHSWRHVKEHLDLTENDSC